MTVRPAKTQISLDIRPVWSESSLYAPWVAKDTSFLHADSEDSDQSGRMPGLIWVFAGRTCYFVGFVMRRLKYKTSQAESQQADQRMAHQANNAYKQSKTNQKRSQSDNQTMVHVINYTQKGG